MLPVLVFMFVSMFLFNVSSFTFDFLYAGDFGTILMLKCIETFYPSSVSTYSSNSNSVIRFNLTGGANEWINLRSRLIGFTLINADNDGTKELRPAYKPSSFFQRMQVMAGSNVIAEIPDLNRYEAMTAILRDDGSRNYTDNLGLGETFYNEGNRFLTYTQLATNPGSNTVQNVIDQATPDNSVDLKTNRPFVPDLLVPSSMCQTSFLCHIARLSLN